MFPFEGFEVVCPHAQSGSMVTPYKNQIPANGQLTAECLDEKSIAQLFGLKPLDDYWWKLKLNSRRNRKFRFHKNDKRRRAEMIAPSCPI